MTRDELREAVCGVLFVLGMADGCLDGAVKDILALFDEAIGWTPVTEETPVPSTEALAIRWDELWDGWLEVLTESGHPAEAWLRNSAQFWCHVAPLPDPPKGV